MKAGSRDIVAPRAAIGLGQAVLLKITTKNGQLALEQTRQNPMSEAHPPVGPPPATASPKPSGGVGASIVSVLLALLLVDVAVETFLAGSPLLISVVVVEVLVLVILALLWSRVGPTTRVIVPLAGLVVLVAWAAVRVGAGADPALRLATLTLPRIVVVLTAVAIAVAAVVPLALFGRRWYLGVPLMVIGLYALVPLARALLVAAALPRVLDVEATNAASGHLPVDTLEIPALNDVRTGSLVCEAPANSQALLPLVLDSANGHLLIPIRDAAPRPASGLGGASRSNQVVDLAVAGVSWTNGPDGRPGTRMLVVGLKGISRKDALADIPCGDWGFLHTDRGCIARPESHAEGVSRPLSPVGRFPPIAPSEGQLAFVVPGDSKSATLLLRVQQRGSLDLPVIASARPAWPAPASTITDGDVLKVHRLPGTSVPAATSRRFALVYDVPPGKPLQFEYRGFNVKSELLKFRYVCAPVGAS